MLPNSPFTARAAVVRPSKEWFAQETNGSSPKRALSVSFFRKGRNEDDRRVVAIIPEPFLQRETIHARHLNVHD
jgi:hypothetical protein